MAWISPECVDPWALPSCPVGGLSELPDCAGIYFAIGVSDVYYIGKTAVSFRMRWDAHHRLKDLILMPGVRIAWLESDMHDSDLVILESELIKIHKPALNKITPKTFATKREPIGADYLVAVKSANDRLKKTGIPIRLSVHKNSLYLRSSRLPSRPGKSTCIRAEIPMGLVSWITIKAAERDAHRMWSACVERRFRWEDYPRIKKIGKQVANMSRYKTQNAILTGLLRPTNRRLLSGRSQIQILSAPLATKP